MFNIHSDNGNWIITETIFSVQQYKIYIPFHLERSSRERFIYKNRIPAVSLRDYSNEWGRQGVFTGGVRRDKRKWTVKIESKFIRVVSMDTQSALERQLLEIFLAVWFKYKSAIERADNHVSDQRVSPRKPCNITCCL